MRWIFGTLMLLGSSTLWAAESMCVRTMEVPEYPTVARAARIEGTVTLNVHIDSDGKVLSAKAQRGHLILREAAEKAIRGWTFKVRPRANDAAEKETIIFVYHIAGDEQPTQGPICPVVTLRSPTKLEITVPPAPVETITSDQP